MKQLLETHQKVQFAIKYSDYSLKCIYERKNEY